MKIIFSVVVMELSTIPNNRVWSQVVKVSLLWVGSFVMLINFGADDNNKAVCCCGEILKLKIKTVPDKRRIDLP